MPGILRKNQDSFIGKDFNPETRAVELDALNATVTEKGGIRSEKEATFHAAVTDENAAASAAVKGVEGVLPATHPFVKLLSNKRDLMVNEAARGKDQPKPQ